MLEIIREKFTGWIAILIISAIAIALVISFGNMNQTPLDQNIVITVNDKEISLFEYREEFTNQLMQVQEILGNQIPDSLEYTIKEAAVENLIMKTLLKDYIEAQGYRVSPEFVTELIMTNSQFQLGENFNRENYEAILLSQGVSLSKFENDLRIQLQIDQLRNGLTGSSFITPLEFRKFVTLQLEEREGEYLMIPLARFSDQVKLDSDEVLSYYKENVESFVTEEEIDVEYLSISIGEIAQSIEFSPLDVKQYYDENIERFRSNEERKSSHILVSFEDDSETDALEEVKNIDQRIKDGESFEALATEFSDDPGSAPNGGDLGWAEPGTFVQEFEQALFSLSAGEISDPIKTQFGYHLIRLDDIKQGRQQSFSEIENELTDEYANVLAKDRLYDVADQLDDLSLQAYNELNSVADSLSLDLKQIKSVTRNGTSLFNEQPEFIDILFSSSSLEQSENTPVFEFDDFIIVARVTNHRLPEMKTFEQVERAITNLLTSEKSVDLATSFVQEKTEGLASDSVLNELLELYDLELQNFNALKRNDNTLPKVFLDKIFDAPEKDIGRNRYNFVVVDETIYLFSVLQMNPGRLDAFSAEERDSGKITLAEQFGSNEVSSFTKALREKAKVEIDSDLFNSAYDL